MRQRLFGLGIVIALAFSLSSPASATPGATVTLNGDLYTFHNPSGGLTYLNQATGVVSTVDDKANTVATSAAWPVFPGGRSVQGFPGVKSFGSGKLLATAKLYGGGANPSVWFSIFNGSSWSAWQTVSLGDRFVVNVYSSRVSSSGNTVAQLLDIDFSNGATTTYLVSNYGGSWHSVLLRDTSATQIDVIGGNNPVQITGQSGTNPQDLTYFMPQGEGDDGISLFGNKAAVVGSATFVMPDFVASGNTFNKKTQMFSQVINLATLTAASRTMIDEPQVSANTGTPDFSEGGLVGYEPEAAWWNKAGNGINVVTRNLAWTSCSTPPGDVNYWAWISANCEQTMTFKQHVGAANTDLFTRTKIPGIEFYGHFQVLHADNGLVALADSRFRALSKNGAGELTGAATNTAFAGYTWLAPNSNGEFAPYQITEVESDAWDGLSQHTLKRHRGVAMDSYETCNVSESIDTQDCTISLNFFGDGRTSSFGSLATVIGTETTQGYVEAHSTGNKIALTKSLITFQEGSGPVFQEVITPNFYEPAVTRTTATLASFATSVKVKKTLSLPVASQQKHPVTWSLATASKKFCTLTITKVNGVITKAVVKGINAGKCSVTAKTTDGFYVKALNKTVTISVKK